MRFRDLKKYVEDLGFVLIRQTASHNIFQYPSTKKTVVISNHSGEILPLRSYMSQIKRAMKERD